MSSTPPADTPTPAAAINAAIANLSTDVLQGEIQARVAARLPVADYQAALAARQAVPIDPKVAADYAAHGVAKEPAHYNFNFGALAQALPADRLQNVRAEATKFAADLALAPSTGTALVQRIGSLGPMVSKMTASERADWIAKNEAVSLRVTGSQEALAALRADALEVLKRSGSDISVGLANSAVLSDPILLRMLGNHHRALQMLSARGK